TLAVAREATFWGVPAIAFSRVKEARPRDGDVDWLARLLRHLWDRRNAWFADAHWLSINLPAELPAEIVQPTIGRDKIGRSAIVVNEDGENAELIFPRGRDHRSTPGDENSFLASGKATINRLTWLGEGRLDPRFVSSLP